MRFCTRTFCTRRVQRAIERAGCRVVRTTGKHTIYQAPCGRRFSLPTSHHTISARVLKHATDQVEISWDEVLQKY